MRKISYILPATALLMLSACYDSEYVLKDHILGDLQTEPAVITEGSHVSLSGNPGDMASDLIFYQIGRTSDFSGESVSIKPDKGSVLGLPLAELGGKYYYRLGVVAGSDTVYAPNVETFSVDVTLQMDSVEMLRPYVGQMQVESNVLFNEKLLYWLVSTDESFENAERYGFVSDIWESDGKYYYQGSADCFVAGTTYYIKACVDVLLGTLESDVMSFTTEKNTIESVTIYGNGQDGQAIKDDLLIVIQNQESKEWSIPYRARYDENKRNYVIEDFNFELAPETYYAVYAVSGETTWDSSGYVVFSGDDYNSGAKQTPIYWGVTEIGWTVPYLKLELQEWTCSITVSYPADWGKINEILLYDQKKNLPGNAFDIINRKDISNSDRYIGRSGEGAVLSNDGSQYMYTFNIFPVNLNKEYCSITLPLASGERIFICPDLKMESGHKYSITLEQDGLEVTDVTVKPWEETEGGNITLTK